MKKILLVSVITLLAIAVFGAAGLAYAQDQTPPAPIGPGWMHWNADQAPQAGTYGPGMMRGARRGGMGGGMMGAGQGPLHSYMLTAFAANLGLTESEIQTQLDAGIPMWQIALDQGLTEDQVVELMDRVHDEALQAAVAAGDLTQEQADWMAERMDSRQGAGFGAGGCHGSGRGFGRGWQQTPANPSN